MLVGGRYRLAERVGRGAMGSVWRARDEVLDRPVAAKQLTASAAQGLAEARLAARVRHPNVAAVHDFLEPGWLVMDYHPIGTLADVLRGGRRVPPAIVAALGLQLLAALQAVHAAGVVHCDVKPANLLLGEDGRLVLVDFGIAAAGGTGPVERDSPDVVVGSPSYMAPERIQGQTPGPAADLWSLGVVLHTAVEGRPPFPAGDPAETLAAVVLDSPSPARLAGPLRPLIEALLVKDPTARPSYDTVHALLTVAGPAGPEEFQLRPRRPARISDRTRCQTTARWPAAATHPTGGLSGPPSRAG
jgi:eukaryotic-like serine/threonine-protein kinase